MKKTMLLLAALMVFMNVAFAATPTCKNNPLYCPWLIYYSSQGKASEFKQYDPIVFDSVNHPALSSMKSVKNLLGRLSFGSVNVNDSYYNNAQSAGLLISPIPNSPGNWYVDIRKPYWQNLLLTQLVPAILKEGFTGIFIDDLDYSIYLEQTNPSAYTGMAQAAINLVSALRSAFPQIPLMMNNAYKILNSVGGYLNFTLGSSLLTSYNTQTKTYYYVPLKKYQASVKYLQNAQALFPNLVVMSLDYCNPADSFTLQNIYNEEYKNGFRPYASSAGLQSITPAP